VLAGHGLVTCGPTAQTAMLRAMDVDTLARMSLDVVKAGGDLRPVSLDDRRELPDLGAAFNSETLWRHHLACLAADGWDIDGGLADG
jgi:3,4-dihydroxyphthalate decarboxylase